MRRLRHLCILLIVLFTHILVSEAQNRYVGNFLIDETELYAMTKQMSQFFSRFNNEEDQFGKKYHPASDNWRNNEGRRRILPLLFDQQNQRTAGTLRDYFVDDLTSGKGRYLEFLGGRWYAEVSSTFEFQGRQVPISLILMIQRSGLGSKWVLTNVYFSQFNRMFPVGEIAEKEKHFLHPMSHELDFMNIHKAFQQPEVIEYYASDVFQPNYLSIFFYEVKLGRMKFVRVESLKFHFFQVPDWYFEVSWFNRTGMNSGWLISNLMFVKEEEKPLLKFYEP